MAREWDVPGYTEVKTLGSGGFGDVVLARHDASGTQVAIKYLRRQLLDDPEFAELFRAEAAVLASLDDPNVALLGKLAALPDRSALPAPMLQDLTTAWQASGEADQDFAKWAQDEISQGCSTNYQSDASYQAATVSDDQATTYKKAFAALWTATAEEYGLPSYQYNQI